MNSRMKAAIGRGVPKEAFNTLDKTRTELKLADLGGQHGQHDRVVRQHLALLRRDGCRSVEQESTGSYWLPVTGY